jgi:DNA mismatch repair protein MutL
MAIQRLPDDVISKIAAGEVVERPASVVKELLENALDAQATHIHIDIAEGGRRRIRISDDGAGIPANEVELALTRHATSKLRNADDLQFINTLGFRGEALASIAAVSQLTLVTRHRDEDIGTQARVEGGIIVQQKPIGAPAGTVITIENLFFNTPARLKFLKSETTEKRHIQTIITNYAMAYPAVRFVLVQDGREIFRSSGSGQLGDVVVKVLGLDHFKEMIEIAGNERIRETGGMIDVTGFVSTPNLHRKDRTRIITFVNGRAVQDRNLTYAITQAYHTLIDKGRHPFAVTMITVPTDFVDVNVHPTKSEVRFQNTNVIFTAVQRTVRQAILGYAQASRQTSYGTYQQAQDQSGWAHPYDKERQMDMSLALDERAEQEANDRRTDDPTAIPEGMGRPDKPRTLPPLRIVGQIGAAYIVSEGPAGMYLIDQHAAHMRVLYQELKDLHAQQTRIPSRQLESQTIDVSAQDARVIDDHLDTLDQVGFQLELFGTNTYQIRAVPTILQAGDPTDMIYSLLDTLRAASSTLIDDLLMRIAERGATKAGQILNTDDMRGLIRKLERCPDPLTSPTGVATLIHMSAEDLAREFGRNSRT